MHTTDTKANDNEKEALDDGPSIMGRFSWTVVGNTCIPCLLKNDGTKYVSVRIAESKVLGHFLHKLNIEVFNCVSVKSFGITEAENKLLNEINSKHCEYAFGRDPFTTDSDFIVKLDDLIEFYNFMDICYNKLLLQTPANDRSNKCGFVRINDDSVVPYAVKNDQKYVPLFYFEGETESLKTKAINLENWDLAYLKFCCKVQGIKNELFASEQCLVTSLEDVKSYFPEGTKFDDYWPSKIVEMQQSNTRNDVNSNHSWVQTPHIDSSSVPQSSVPNSSHSVSSKTIPSALSKQLHNQRSTSAVITNISPSLPVYQQNNTWSAMMGNTVNTVPSNTYQLTQPINQTRVGQKQSPAVVHSMNASVAPPRSYVNQNLRQRQQYYASPHVPNVTGATQPPPPLVRVSAANSVPNAYANSIQGDTYSHVYTNNAPLPALYSMTVPRHANNISSSTASNKIRNMAPSQMVAPTVTRFPPALTPINGTSNIQTSNPTTVHNALSSNVGSAVVSNTRSQRTNFSQAGAEIIDLSSPPHSPQYTNNSSLNRLSSVSSNSFNYGKANSNSHLPPLIHITDGASPLKNGIPPYKVQTVTLREKPVQVINLKANVDGEHVIPLQDIITYYFPRVEMSKLRHVLQSVLKINLFKGNPGQLQVLREYHKGKPLSDDVPLMLIKDFDSHYRQLVYMESSMMTNDLESSERDVKRPKIS